MPLILTLDAALAEASVGLVRDGIVLAHVVIVENPAAALALEADRLLRDVAVPPNLVAVTVGPGSFTGLRAAIALAHGVAIGAGIAVAGVALADAYLFDASPGRVLWTAISNKRGAIWLVRADTIATVTLDTLPVAGEPVAIAGDSANDVAARLSARGEDAVAIRVHPSPAGIAAAAQACPRPALPLYADPPLARPGPPTRPAPV